MEKMTQKDFFNEIIALAKANDREDLATFAAGRIEALNRKTANKKPTAKQTENEAIMDTLVEILTVAENSLTVTEIIKTGKVGEVSNQKISALLKKLVDAGMVVKTVDKKVSRFTVA